MKIGGGVGKSTINYLTECIANPINLLFATEENPKLLQAQEKYLTNMFYYLRKSE